MSHTHRDLADAEWRMERATAEQVDCRDCGQQAGETCINLRDSLPLVKQTAHASRIKDATAREAS